MTEQKFIEITEKRVSTKVQPLLRVGNVYRVVDSDGDVLLLEHPNDKKKTLRCSPSRFAWKAMSFEDVRERNFRIKCEEDNARLRHELTDKDRLNLSFYPRVLEALAWIYTDKVLDYCASHKLREYAALSRAVREVRKEYERWICKDVSRDVLDKIFRRAKAWHEELGTFFFQLRCTIHNEFARHYKHDIPDFVLYAGIGMWLIDAKREHEWKMDNMLRQKLRTPLVDDTAEIPAIVKLYDCLDAYKPDGCFLSKDCFALQTTWRSMYNMMQRITYEEN